jgi:hypothetical protein
VALIGVCRMHDLREFVRGPETFSKEREAKIQQLLTAMEQQQRTVWWKFG